MDIEEIKGLPEFEHDIDPFVYNRIPQGETRDLAETISKLRQEVRWVADHAIVAHNMSVQTAQMLKKLALGTASVMGMAVLGKLVEWMLHH